MFEPYRPSRQDFQPLQPVGEQCDTLSDVMPKTHSETYWSGVWRRLWKKPQARVSLLFLVILMIFTGLGPWLWPVSPDQQSLGQVSALPQQAKSALLVQESDRWYRNLPTLATDPVTVVEAHTEWVRLQWQPIEAAAYYQIYRHSRIPLHRHDLGLPIGQTYNASQHYFQDRLNLRPQQYVYTVVAVTDSGEQLYPAVTVTLSQAMTVFDAQLQGLLPEQLSEPLPTYIQLMAHPLGTDALGRDMLARLIHGARTSLFIGIVAPLLFISLGVVYGAVAGYAGGRIDDAMMRVADFVIALPFLLFMILFKVLFGIGPGESGVMPMLLAMVLLSWPSCARLVRGQVLQLRQQAYVEAAQLMGASRSYLIRRHMLPNVLGVVLVSLSFAIPSAIFTEAFLSFIGLGVVPPTPSWGAMSNDGMKTLLSYPHELLLPSLFISLTVLSFNLLGDALRDALDTQLEGL